MCILFRTIQDNVLTSVIPAKLGNLANGESICLLDTLLQIFYPFNDLDVVNVKQSVGIEIAGMLDHCIVGI